VRRRYTDEVRNVAFAPAEGAGGPELLAFETSGPWAELLAELDVSLAVSREYEHLLLLLGAAADGVWQTALPLPHPSGLFWDEERRELIVSSTRTPNQIFFFRPLGAADYVREIVPADLVAPEGTLFLPSRSLLLPGTLYIHDVVLLDGGLYVTATGHNFLARVDPAGGWERAWWPACVDGLGRASFDQNYLQLNSIARAGAPEASYYTAFSDETSGPKPWKAGYGPRGRGVVFAGATRGVVRRGLTCPHSAKLRGGSLWLCNSGYGEVGVVPELDVASDANPWEPLARLPGFTRGLAFAGDYAFVGLSKVIDFYEPYAPGLDPKASRCGVVAVDVRSGAAAASLTWPRGYQIYDVQVLPGVRRPLLPSRAPDADGINVWLRYLG
jgi:uncharacterized protein (TIGR03032 family)